MEITSPAFLDGSAIPEEFTCDGKDYSPPIIFSGVPSSAKGLVLITDDADSSVPGFTHWLVFDIYPGTTRIDSGSTPEGIQCPNSFGKEYYGGPCPNTGTHHYYFRLYALDKLLKLPINATREMVETAMKGHVIESCELMGTYTKKE